MIVSRTVALLSLPFFVAAQYGAPAASPTGTSAAAAASPTPSGPVIVVGNGGTTFTPSHINATVGTVVTFQFTDGKTHSVTQSSFGQPCTHLAANATANTPDGFDSSTVSTGKSWSIMITGDKPIWFFCKVATHCSKGGMFGAINAPATGNTFTAFSDKAKAITNQPPQPDNGPINTGVNAKVVDTPSASASASPTTSGSSATSTSKSSGAAGALNASVGLSLLGVLLAFITA